MRMSGYSTHEITKKLGIRHIDLQVNTLLAEAELGMHAGELTKRYTEARRKQLHNGVEPRSERDRKQAEAAMARAEAKAKAIEMRRYGASLKAIGDTFGVDKETIRIWLRKHERANGLPRCSLDPVRTHSNVVVLEKRRRVRKAAR